MRAVRRLSTRAADAPVHLRGPKPAGGGAPSAAAQQRAALAALELEPSHGARFRALGLGGLDGTLSAVLRRAFASRLAPPSAAKALGVRHVRGLLLHGPPGTGKTLVARRLAELLRAKPPKLVAGPEIFASLVGESEERLRALFEPAEREWRVKGEQSALHVIVFDEVRARAAARVAARVARSRLRV